MCSLRSRPLAGDEWYLLEAPSPRTRPAPGEHCARTDEMSPRCSEATSLPRTVWTSCRNGVIDRMAIFICSRYRRVLRRSVHAYIVGPTLEFVVDRWRTQENTGHTQIFGTQTKNFDTFSGFDWVFLQIHPRADHELWFVHQCTCSGYLLARTGDRLLRTPSF